ncbi:MAG: DUF378 domain-containing protein [Alphaproteobacteria bacterium]|nr:DUF378 domain-containing protein [Alphaproteobacteria bacterium]
MQILIKILAIVCLIGALNWGLVGFFGFDLIAAIFGPMSIVSRLIYALVGLSGVALIILSIKQYKQLAD